MSNTEGLEVETAEETRERVFKFLSTSDRIPPRNELFRLVSSGQFGHGYFFEELKSAGFKDDFSPMAHEFLQGTEQFRMSAQNPVHLCIAKTHWLTKSYNSKFSDLICGIDRVGGPCPYWALPALLRQEPDFIHPHEQMVVVSSFNDANMLVSARRDDRSGREYIRFAAEIFPNSETLSPDTLWMFAI